MQIILLVISFLILFLIYIYAENSLLILKRYKINFCENTKNNLKIVQISDIHKKHNEVKIVEKVQQINPDIILLTGDIVSRSERGFSHFKYLTNSLSKICPVYACAGNHELDLPDDIHAEYRETMRKNGINYLENSQAVFEKGDLKVKIAGASLKMSIYKNKKGGYSDLEDVSFEELESDLGKKEGFTILLAHNPLCAEAYAQWGADVVFSGHIHGGSVRLPFVGGVLSPERKFFPKYSKGVYEIGETKMIVSGGIGKLRIFNPPEIVLCELETLEK